MRPVCRCFRLYVFHKRNTLHSGMLTDFFVKQNGPYKRIS